MAGELHGAIVGGAIDGGGSGACDGEAGAHIIEQSAGNGFGARFRHIVGAILDIDTVFPKGGRFVIAHKSVGHIEVSRCGREDRDSGRSGDIDEYTLQTGGISKCIRIKLGHRARNLHFLQSSIEQIIF